MLISFPHFLILLFSFLTKSVFSKYLNMELKRVVVTGLGAVTPLGLNPEETWENLKAGKSGAAPITLFDASQFKTQFACEVKGLNINDYIDTKELRNINSYITPSALNGNQGVMGAIKLAEMSMLEE